MGGYGSGRSGGRPTADASLRIDIALMLRTRKAIEGALCHGTLHWTCRGEPSGSISYVAAMHEPENERPQLSYSNTRQGQKEEKVQTVRLSYTVPNFGGKRWWMHCPITGQRVGKLYLPNGGDVFASRTAWRLGYHSQRVTKRDQPFERLFRLQEKLGCRTGFEQPIFRPKGMWRRTWQRHLDEHERLDAICSREFAALMSRLA